jgi:hypothetical protein
MYCILHVMYFCLQQRIQPTTRPHIDYRSENRTLEKLINIMYAYAIAITVITFAMVVYWEYL